jgi:hypothetical protein
LTVSGSSSNSSSTSLSLPPSRPSNSGKSTGKGDRHRGTGKPRHRRQGQRQRQGKAGSRHKGAILLLHGASTAGTTCTHGSSGRTCCYPVCDHKHKHAPAMALRRATLNRERRAMICPTRCCARPVMEGLGTQVWGSTVTQISSTTCTQHSTARHSR